MGQRKVGLTAAVVAVAAAGLTMLSAGSAAARPALSATSTTQAPPFALVEVSEGNDPTNPLRDNGAFAVGVDSAGNLGLYTYQDLDVAGRTADWANGGAGAIIGTGWQNFPLVFAAGGAIYATTTDGKSALVRLLGSEQRQRYLGG